MMVAMQADLVTHIGHPPYQARELIGHIPQDKERNPDPCLV
jgi:hypothetical protein